jgi:hypothetical protein
MQRVVVRGCGGGMRARSGLFGFEHGSDRHGNRRGFVVARCGVNL